MNIKLPKNKYIDSAAGDTGYYTFSGTKLMARADFDIKGIIPMDFLGKEDLKIYGELTILGVKNYPGFYTDLKARMPMMFGFNVPTFKLLDLLKLEFEFQDTKVANGIGSVFYSPYCPIPDSIPGVLRSPWKWSVYANKKIGSHLSIIGQIANDHLMPENYSVHNLFQPLNDVTLRANDWWWVLKMRFDY
jgi:hypothetical protein